MVVVINIITIVVLLITAIQDFRFREIHWATFPTLACLFLIEGLIRTSYESYIKESLCNLLFLAIQVFALVIYYLFKGNSLRIFINTSIGLGDIIFFLVIVLAFSQFNFIVFYISGLFFSLTIWVIIRVFAENKQNMVPLAGLFSVFMILILVLENLPFGFNRFSDFFLIELFNG
jgi:hypothetical protein